MNSIFSDQKTGFDWARNVLAEADIDPAQNPVVAIKELRSKEPALNLKTATYMVKKSTQPDLFHQESVEETRLSPHFLTQS
ncbi:hypothetical protein [Dermatophilus congolensis]|uniref:hypothetical protein n=1 Tax=Dermatophilus congolensis TaxID=1863 RepID=UPI001AAF3E4A|nr:hypothetical protein [Dermatophilus congolensis]MBO3129489.1 hypothetical protein [Dermatophilus congolensis]MBO3131878.1 hypothetical protein [Dermatophilus congolensis]MBO3133965.1 hypothetical protein [Dermatophilus congolensis]MBO3136196.1 hypothetical protein [Dermatophilus congolensis]MBO3138442.1 hypothetical protein [Dermatophilus congolensis]